MKTLRLVTFLGFFLALAGALYGLCTCTLTIELDVFLPRQGTHTLQASGGTVFVDARPVAVLNDFMVDMNIEMDPKSPEISWASLTAASGVVPATEAFDTSIWSLGEPTASCPNTFRLDFSLIEPDAENVTGCFVLDVEGGFVQEGVEVVVDGTNFDPAGMRSIEAIGSSDNFAFLQALFGDGFESGDATAWTSSAP